MGEIFTADLSLSDWASMAGIAGAVGTVVGLFFVLLQVVSGTRATRAQATILFQERFKESRGSRDYLFKHFPLHTSLAQTVEERSMSGKRDLGEFKTWTTLADLSEDDRDAASAVVRALNDVAQYVVDGLELRSALQQYHLIFIRMGALLTPYLEQINEPVDGKRQIRLGRRVPILYNAALAYHRCSPKHKGREIDLRRSGVRTEDPIRIVLLDADGEGLQQFSCFADSPSESLALPLGSLRAVIKSAEATLRQ